jgi:hypothetical protein
VSKSLNYTVMLLALHSEAAAAYRQGRAVPFSVSCGYHLSSLCNHVPCPPLGSDGIRQFTVGQVCSSSAESCVIDQLASRPTEVEKIAQKYV